MANQEHLDILKQGVEIWNRWRQEHRDIQPDLSGADLSRANLAGADLFRADLSGADLSGTNLTDANLNMANLAGTNLTDANFSPFSPDIYNLSSSNLARANFSEANFIRAIFSPARLNGANLSSAHLFGANLISADLSEANLSEAHLSATNLNMANLSKAKLSRANLSGAEFYSGADLSGADLSGADLSEANLSRANLSNANLSEATLSEATLSEATIGWTLFGNVDLSKVKGLETVVHWGPSTIGIDTIYRSRGNIPEAFLGDAGVDDNFITYIRSLVGKTIEYYSCFISYSSKDEAFAKKLHTDLQSRGVRCWFAPEDLKIGDKIRPRIDESIRLHDKLLLVLSQYSVASQWVEQEVERALARERKESKVILFPIRLDKTVMDIEEGWPALIRNTRNIGDFTRWKRYDAYQKALDRLIRDLKAEASKPKE